MSSSERKMRKTLDKIRRIVDELDVDNIGEEAEDANNHDDEDGGDVFRACTPKVLPTRLLVDAAKTAIKINPVNAPLAGPMAAAGAGFDVDDPLRIAVVTAKYWGPTPRQLTVSFMEETRIDLKKRIVQHLNAWSTTSCVSFVLTNGVGQVRISRGAGGFYSFLGTDILHIPRSRQTMNLQGFTMSTPESEYRRVVRHEAGHTLGFPHEHMRAALVRKIDREKAFDYFWRTNRWDRATVIAQVLTSLDERTIVGTPSDQDSIMCYQLPGSITTNGQPIRGGADINATDFAFAGRIYPKVGRGALAGVEDEDSFREEWDASEDVEVEV